MSISRRHFLLGTAGAAAGLILPSYYRRALEFIDRAGRPLLEAVDQPRIELTAVAGDWDGMRYRLAVGDPFAGPPPMTLGQFCDRYGAHHADDLCFDDDGNEVEPDWNAPVDWDHGWFYEVWMDRDAPDQLAYDLLCDLDLGPAEPGGAAFCLCYFALFK